MEKSNLLQVFRSMSSRELRELSKFLVSPYFNQRKDVITLFDIIKEHLQTPLVNFNKPAVFGEVYPHEKFSDAKMRHLMSYLLELVKQYWIQKSMDKDILQKKIHLCRTLRLKELNQLFEKEWKKTKQLQKRQKYRNTQFHFNNYHLHLERYEWIHRQQRSGDMNLQELSDELTTFYVADILRQSCSVLTHKTMSKQEYKIELLAEVLKKVEQGWLIDNSVVAIYYHAYRSLNHLENEQDFKKLQQLIHKHWREFPPSEIRDIYLLAINYCIKKLNKGSAAYIRASFELYRSGLENEILLENGKISPFTYNNVLKLGLALEELDWIENFLEVYKKLLPQENRENIYQYNLAIFYFQKPDFTKAMRLLQKVEFKDMLHNLDARRMLLRIYFELNEYDALISLFESFKTYIHRQKNIGYHRDNYLNLIFFAKKLLTVNLKDEKSKKNLISEIKQTEAVAEKKWLLEKLRK